MAADLRVRGKVTATRIFVYFSHTCSGDVATLTFNPDCVSMPFSVWLWHVGESSVDVTSLGDTGALDGGAVGSREGVALVDM